MAEGTGKGTAELVERAKQGDRDVFDDLCWARRDRLVRFVLGRYGGTLGPADAEDMVQMALVAAWQKLGNLRKPGAFWRWFYRILRSKSLAACRVKMAMRIVRDPDGTEVERMVYLTPELAEAASGASTPGEAYRRLVRVELVEAARRRLRRVYERLTDVQRAVFVVRYVKLLDEKKAAALTGLPVGTLRSAYWHISKLLRKEFGASEFGDAPVLERRVAVIEALASWEEERPEGAAI